jgi:hypothetical protein
MVCWCYSVREFKTSPGNWSSLRPLSATGVEDFGAVGGSVHSTECMGSVGQHSQPPSRTLILCSSKFVLVCQDNLWKNGAKPQRSQTRDNANCLPICIASMYKNWLLLVFSRHKIIISPVSLHHCTYVGLTRTWSPATTVYNTAMTLNFPSFTPSFHMANLRKEPVSPSLPTLLWEKFSWSDLTIKSECRQKVHLWLTVVITSLSSSATNLTSSSFPGKRVRCFFQLGLINIPLAV